MNKNAFGQPLSRRTALQLLGVGGAGAALTACAGPGSTAGSTSAASAPATGKPTGAISFAHWRAEDKDVFAKLISAFQSATPDVTVRQDISPSNDYQSSALQRIRGGSVGDVFTAFRGAQFVDMVKAGVYTDMSKQAVVQQYEPSLITAGQQDGTQYGFPYQVVFNMPVTNEDIIGTATGGTPPKDWQSFLDLCDKLKSQGLVPIAWPGGDPGNAGQLFNSMVMNNAPSDDMCAKIESGEYKCTDDWFLTTLKQYQQLKPYFQPNSTGTAVEPCQQIFATKKAAMLATGSYHIAAIRALGATFPMNVISPITTSAEKAKYEGIYNATFILGVNSHSQHQAAASAWLEFLSQPANAGEYANGTSQHVTVKGVEYTNPDLKALAPWLQKKTLLAPRFQFNNLDIRSAVEGACIAVVGGKSPDAAAADAQRVVDQQRSQ
ncbi:extracellular solute-binding protein [Nostocoides sp. Soil756]|jgi:raffinose/stachyose/melibiose transport system substrate-binding protein|uniref:ABC transporter substrate-binding protein n=1 Tax=Nostocoides sp. Soil756 TaxID=1736399 RepID=UPI0006FB5593|nr:extracellular solute-binding protein [Tetrasphaera sp. Soil756]KRE60956.1 ABC transporter substrate-binding protein [Tetrasphaera sp. Soil756]